MGGPFPWQVVPTAVVVPTAAVGERPPVPTAVGVPSVAVGTL